MLVFFVVGVDGVGTSTLFGVAAFCFGVVWGVVVGGSVSFPSNTGKPEDDESKSNTSAPEDEESKRENTSAPEESGSEKTSAPEESGSEKTYAPEEVEETSPSISGNDISKETKIEEETQGPRPRARVFKRLLWRHFGIVSSAIYY